MEKNLSQINGIKVRYIYSACIVTSTPDISILHDPWFTEGIYDGSWYHFPKIQDPLKSIGNVDLIYISHVHPDHYDGRFLKSYFSRYGKKEIIIADHSPNHLAGKMKADGFEFTVLSTKLEMGKTSIEIIPHKTGSISDIDSAIIIKYSVDGRKPHCLVNANDVIFDDSMIAKVVMRAGDVDILLSGYTGAGPYPQTYFDINDPELISEGEKKKNEFFERYKKVTTEIGARVNIPFAGKYLLGGKLAGLNQYRGVSDPIEVLAFDAHAIVLADNGGSIDTANYQPTDIRLEPYDEQEMVKRVAEIKGNLMNYERLISASEIGQLPIERLLRLSAVNALNKSECTEDYFFSFKLPNDQFFVINANKNELKNIALFRDYKDLPIPRSEINIDVRYLFGLMTKIYHWNNAEIGSQYQVRRYPNHFNRSAQNFLNYLTV